MIKVLIVDDVKGWRDYHSLIISHLFPNSEVMQADSARDGYDILMQHTENPFDIIITDLQMENDFEPQYAGEWLVKQIKTFNAYKKSKVVIISAAYNIRHIAEELNVLCIPKPTAYNFPDSYGFLKDC